MRVLYRNTKRYPVDLANGGIVRASGSVTLDAKAAAEAHNAALIDEGVLLAQPGKPKPAKPADKPKDGDA